MRKLNFSYLNCVSATGVFFNISSQKSLFSKKTLLNLVTQSKSKTPKTANALFNCITVGLLFILLFCLFNQLPTITSIYNQPLTLTYIFDKLYKCKVVYLKFSIGVFNRTLSICVTRFPYEIGRDSSG